jgi:filamentous hemagglutinin family protein
MNIGCILALIFAWSVVEPSLVLAQVTTAITPTTGGGSLDTTVNSTGNTVQITGGTRPSNGSNLFHSFDQFNVGRGDTAQFLNTTPSIPTSNILSRVTGGNPSSIFGTIDTMSYPGANLLLMNPAGIVFGPNATLNVSGSVAFTTANYLRLADANGSNAGIFHADPTATSLLTSAPVTAFGFLGTNPSAMSVQGTEKSQLSVQPGQSISVVGGNKRFTYINPDTGVSVSVQDGVAITSGHLLAPGGQINIASAASPGEFLAGTLDQATNINGQSFRGLGTVQVSEQSSIDTSGQGDGTIHIRGGRLTIDNSNISASTGEVSLHASSILIKNSAAIITSTSTEANSGHVTLMASGDISLDAFTAVYTFASPSSSGHAGNIMFNSSQGNVKLTNNVQVLSYAETNSSGNTGSITVEAPHGDISVDSSHIFNSASGDGTLGEIQIKAHNLRLETASSIGVENTSTGTQKPGDTQITLDGRLSLTDGSFINTTARTSLDSANLIIRAPEIFISSKNSAGTISGLYNNTLSSGDGGRLLLFTDNLELTNGGRLFGKSTIPNANIVPLGHGGEIVIQGYRNPGPSVVIDGTGSGIFTSAEGTGPAGDIDVSATSVTIQNGGEISADTTGTSSNATGGSIIINATDHVTLKNGASITASSTGPADAGNISINAGQQLNVEKGKITTEAIQSKAGNINIQAIDQVRVVNGEISTSVRSGAGRGGDITIDPKTVILQDGTKVFAQAVQGSGGNITITTPLYLKDSTSNVNADSQFGLNGSVTIQSPTSNLSGTVGQLASKTNPPQVLLQNRCIALAGGEQSTFILAGRDALPSEPGGWLSSPVAMEHWTGEEKEHASGLMVRSLGSNGLSGMAALQDKSHVLSMRRLTPPGFLVRSFADSAATGCSS